MGPAIAVQNPQEQTERPIPQMMMQTASLRLQQYASTDTTDLTDPLLTALLKFAPTPAGRDNVAREIIGCLDDKALYNLGQRYLTGLIIPSKPFPFISEIHSC